MKVSVFRKVFVLNNHLWPQSLDVLLNEQKGLILQKLVLEDT